MRRRMRQCNAGRKDKRCEIPPIRKRKIFDPDTRCAGLLSRVLVVVPDGDTGAALDQGLGRDKTRAAQSKHGGMLAIERSDRRHRHLNFKVARPTSASTKAMIQKRTTTCGSDQPSCSKW